MAKRTRPTPEEIAARQAERRARLQERLQRELEENGEPEPPWVRFPTEQAGSIAWRMGAGESWQDLWSAYLDQMPVEDRWAYLRRHPPAPWDWRRKLGYRLLQQEPRPDRAAREELERRLIDEGVIGEDVAYGLWLDRCARADDLPPPWRRTRTPFRALRSAGRRLGFWARWAAAASPELRVDWLSRQPEAPEAWRTVVEAFGSREPPRTRETARDLVVELAASGTLAPPWTYGAEPRLEGPYGILDYADDAAIAAMWGWWATDVFDDPPTWWRYLERWAPPRATGRRPCAPRSPSSRCPARPAGIGRAATPRGARAGWPARRRRGS